MRIDLNADLGEGFGAWAMGDDSAMLAIVTSANVACGGHAGDPEVMYATVALAKSQSVVIGAHPGYADLAGFGRRVIPMTAAEVERMVAAQVGALLGVAALAGARVGYVKAHGALANLAAADRSVADAVARAIRAVSRDLAFLTISGTEQAAAGLAQGLQVFSEIFADRGYLPDGRLVPRGMAGAMLEGEAAVARILGFLDSGLMPVVGGAAIRLRAQSVCVHGDSAGAVALAWRLKGALDAAGVTVAPFLSP